jgi:hypothetical protein
LAIGARLGAVGVKDGSGTCIEIFKIGGQSGVVTKSLALEGEDIVVSCVRFVDDSDGELVAGTSVGEVMLWDVPSGRIVWSRNLAPDDGLWVASVSVVLELGLIAVCCTEGGVDLLDRGTGQVMVSTPRHSALSAVFFGGAHFASGSSDGKIRAWDAKDGALLRSVEVGGPVRVLSLSPCGSRLAAACTSGELSLFRLPDWHLAWSSTPNPHHMLTSCSFSPDARFIAVGSEDPAHSVYTVSIIAAATGATVRVLAEGHSERIIGTVFSRTGARLFSASWDSSVIAWRIFSESENKVRALFCGLEVEGELGKALVAKMKRVFEID